MSGFQVKVHVHNCLYSEGETRRDPEVPSLVRVLTQRNCPGRTGAEGPWGKAPLALLSPCEGLEDKCPRCHPLRPALFQLEPLLCLLYITVLL